MRDKLKTFLEQVGANHAHTGRELADHLLGTYDLLKDKGAPEPLCVAGALHSIYSTNAFKTATLTFEQRDLVRETFGSEAENLAYIFCSINRPSGLESGVIVNRFTNKLVFLDHEVIYQLTVLEAANLLEQKLKNTNRYPKIFEAWNNPLQPMTFINEVVNF